MKQPKSWQLLISRETTLLERFLRVDGYQILFGNKSSVKVNNLFIVNHEGLTSQYFEVNERKERLRKIFAEYNQNCLPKLIVWWKRILENLRKATTQCNLNFSKESFSGFIKMYQLGRAIVFYTNDLSKVLEEKKIFDDLKVTGKWHEQAEVESSKAWDDLQLKFNEIAKKYKLQLRDLCYYLPHEFIELVDHGKKLNKAIIKEREKYYVLWLDDGNIKLSVGEKANKWEKEQLHQEKINCVDEINGSVAYPGYARGKVRIVNTKQQMEQMEHGEILVSTMTTPRLISAVHKAIAIITDEGGILCHAAIVSRELKKPCIIGIKNATKILKDGDLVEVDAEKGIIKKIKPSNSK